MIVHIAIEEQRRYPVKRWFVFVLVCCLGLSPGLAVTQDSEKETAAVAAAEKWLLSVDAGNYEQSWRVSGYFIQ
jgi:hypothetical protein